MPALIATNMTPGAVGLWLEHLLIREQGGSLELTVRQTVSPYIHRLHAITLRPLRDEGILRGDTLVGPSNAQSNAGHVWQANVGRK